MYDLILCVLATTKNNRLSQFLEIGYKKSSKYKTKIVYLVDNEDKPDFIKEDWFNCPGHPVSTRFSYYLSVTQDKSRWIMHVDDDSCTDIDKTIELLDYFYNYEDALMITGSSTYFTFISRYINRAINPHIVFSYTLDPSLQQVIKKLQVKNLFVGTEDLNSFEMIPRICHGWEHSVFSFGAIKRIINFSKLQEYIACCLEFKCKFGDEVPFVLAKLAKIPICSCYFFSPTPDIEEYTAINKTGRFSHIHHLAEPLDMVNRLKFIIKNNKFFENKNEIICYLEENIENTDWIFFDYNQKVNSRCVIKLCENEKIEVLDFDKNINLNYKKFNLENKKWKKSDNCILIKNENNQELPFNKIKNKLYSNGNLFLSKLDSIDKIYLNRNSMFYAFMERLN